MFRFGLNTPLILQSVRCVAASPSSSSQTAAITSNSSSSSASGASTFFKRANFWNDHKKWILGSASVAAVTGYAISENNESNALRVMYNNYASKSNTNTTDNKTGAAATKQYQHNNNNNNNNNTNPNTVFQSQEDGGVGGGDDGGEDGDEDGESCHIDSDFQFESVCKVPSADTATTVHQPGYDTYSPFDSYTKNFATAQEIDDICDMDLYTHMPIIPLSEISKHFDKYETGIWVTWKGGVYDVTNFLDHHPGGSTRIEMVGGQDLQAFWDVYTLHRRKHVQQLLQRYRIGNLSPEDQMISEKNSVFWNSYELSDPPRPKDIKHADTINADFIVASVHPWNAEPRDLRILSNNFLTPNSKFFVRNHNAVPVIEEEEYELEIMGIEGGLLKETVLTLKDIKSKFKSHTITSVIQCAGNRQEDYNHLDAPLFVAPHWHNSAIGNAQWTGVKVRDVLKHAGLDVDGMQLGTASLAHQKLKWVSFTGYDADETGVEYAGVLPIEKVIDAWGDCILAYEMNGQPIPRDHGWPLRVVAPGHAGCRQVKWVRKIEIAEKPSENDSGSKLDRHFAPNICFDKLRMPGDSHEDLEQAPVIQTLPVQSLICDYENVDNTFIRVKGIAWAGGGKGIARVDVSIDGGKTFTAARMSAGNGIEKNWNRNWAWIHFECFVELHEDIREKLMRNDVGKGIAMQLVSKAVDDNFNAQPENMQPYYNVLGICINHWKRVNIQLKPI